MAAKKKAEQERKKEIKVAEKQHQASLKILEDQKKALQKSQASLQSTICSSREPPISKPPSSKRPPSSKLSNREPPSSKPPSSDANRTRRVKPPSRKPPSKPPSSKPPSRNPNPSSANMNVRQPCSYRMLSPRCFFTHSSCCYLPPFAQPLEALNAAKLRSSIGDHQGAINILKKPAALLRHQIGRMVKTQEDQAEAIFSLLALLFHKVGNNASYKIFKLLVKHRSLKAIAADEALIVDATAKDDGNTDDDEKDGNLNEHETHFEMPPGIETDKYVERSDEDSSEGSPLFIPSPNA